MKKIGQGKVPEKKDLLAGFPVVQKIFKKESRNYEIDRQPRVSQCGMGIKILLSSANKRALPNSAGGL